MSQYLENILWNRYSWLFLNFYMYTAAILTICVHYNANTICVCVRWHFIKAKLSNKISYACRRAFCSSNPKYHYHWLIYLFFIYLYSDSCLFLSFFSSVFTRFMNQRYAMLNANVIQFFPRIWITDKDSPYLR